MNRIFCLLTLGCLYASSAFAAQTITCKFVDVANTDQVVVTLTSDQVGALLYRSGPQDDSATSADGSLVIKRLVDSGDTASFATQVDVMQMTFKMPKVQILKLGVTFSATLSTQISGMGVSQDQDLACSS